MLSSLSWRKESVNRLNCEAALNEMKHVCGDADVQEEAELLLAVDQ